MTTFRRSFALTLTSLSTVLVTAAGAEVIVYPKAGQSAEAFEKDQVQCHQIAQQNTGFNPAQAAAAPPPPPPQQGGAVRGAARGATVGAVGGAIGGDAGKGAAVGAAVGAVGGRMRQNQANRANAQMAQQQQAQQQSGMQAYDNSYAACMAQRGYQPK
jgi:OmpA family protein